MSRIFKLSVTTREEWERRYEVNAENIDEAKAKVEQEVIWPVGSTRESIMIISITEK